MKNLFLNLYADIQKVSISEAKGEIKHRVALRMRGVFNRKGYSYKERKEAIENIITDNIDEIYDNGDLNLSGEIFDFTNFLFEPYMWHNRCPSLYLK